MKTKTGTHTTNYFNTFIEVAEDTKAIGGKIPASKSDKKTIAEIEYNLIANHPYQFTSDDVLFQVYADRNDLIEPEYKTEREKFFSKGQACLRASPLTKTYGFGIHSDSEGRVALFGMETKEYQNFLEDQNIQKVKAMRNARKK